MTAPRKTRGSQVPVDASSVIISPQFHLSYKQPIPGKKITPGTIPYSFSTVPHLHGGIAYHIHLQSSRFQHFLSLLSLELPIYIKDMFPCTPIQIPFFLISESSHTFHIQSIFSSDL
jgi:hypothetical protein